MDFSEFSYWLGVFVGGTIFHFGGWLAIAIGVIITLLYKGCRWWVGAV